MPEPATRPSKLPRGASALDPDAVAAAHRARLQRATVALLAERGYTETTVADIAREAGVSTNAFYVQYANKADCVLATWDALVAELDAAIAPASSGRPPADTLEHALAGVIGAVVHIASRRPDDLRLALTGVLAVGPEGPDRRRRLVDIVAARAREAIGHALQPAPIADIAVTAVAGGLLAVVEQRLGSPKPRWPRSLVSDLAAWGASYVSDQPLDAPGADARGHLHPAPGPSPELARLPRGHNKLPRAFVIQHQRRRILRAVAALARERGYAGVTVPEIAARAHISTRTFYECFADKEEAFLATFDAAFTRLFARAFYAAAAQANWEQAVREGVAAWLGVLAEDPELSRFGLNDVLTADDGAAKLEEARQAFAHLLSHGLDHTADDRIVPAIVPYAIAGGIAAVVAEWVVAGRARELPELAPQLCFLGLAPFVGDAAASHVAA